MNNYLFKSCESRRRWYREGTGSCVVARPKVIVQQNNKKLIISSESLNIQRRHCVVRNAMHCCAFADAFYCISGVVKCILAGDRVSAQRQSRRTVTSFVTAEIKIHLTCCYYSLFHFAFEKGERRAKLVSILLLQTFFPGWVKLWLS